MCRANERNSSIHVLRFAAVAHHRIVLVGLLRLESWALTGALVLYGLNVLINLATMSILGVVISGIIIAYLLSTTDKFD
ncbi:hypothetical protein [Natrialba sp. INN-245]|uniref:hypothetical protein n=1 Tax=Natrialba sp. INN-245 TaxID=2690967 RepID=UPI001310703C|nr:hypothetical protein [Natrialba sp. INN-245]MWV41791.1 hypothetical protein [Natrialba sp. INN-245]